MPLYKRKDSEVWWIDVRHAGHRIRQSSGTTDRAAAQEYERKTLVELWTHVPSTRGATWGKAVKLWLEAEDRSDSELLSLAKFGRVYQDRPLDQVTGDSLEQGLAFCKTAGTFMRYRAMLFAILNQAKAKGWIAELPRMATRRDKKTKAREWITEEQWAKLYKELPKHMKPMAAFALETGLRQANVLGLKWSSISIARQTLWLDAQDMKSDTALSVPLSDRAIEVLESVAGQHKEFVFTYRGHPIKEIKTAFQAACIRAGVPDFTWHGLRHTWATWHVQNGTPLDVLQKLGGWADLRMVMNYAHHSPSYLARFAGNNRK